MSDPNKHEESKIEGKAYQILIVDDEPLMRSLLLKALERKNHCLPVGGPLEFREIQFPLQLPDLRAQDKQGVQDHQEEKRQADL